jgi:predicted amidohydrolase
VQLVACDSPAGRLGLTVCYDLRFPEVYQTLTWSMGAKVLLVPSAFTKVTGGKCWDSWRSQVLAIGLRIWLLGHACCWQPNAIGSGIATGRGQPA